MLPLRPNNKKDQPANRRAAELSKYSKERQSGSPYDPGNILNPYARANLPTERPAPRLDLNKVHKPDPDPS